MHGLATACILVKESSTAADADVVARHHIAQHKTGAVITQGAVIDLAIAPHAHCQGARRDGEGGRAAQADVVLGRPQARQVVIAHVERIAVAEAAIDARVTIEQAHVADGAEEGGQLAIVDLAAGIVRDVHLQRFQKSLQHRRRVAVVDAPDAAEIVAVETALLLHLGCRAAAGAALVHLDAGRFVIPEGKRHSRARVGTAHHAARRAGGKTVAGHGTAAVDIAGTAARHAPADQPAQVFMD